MFVSTYTIVNYVDYKLLIIHDRISRNEQADYLLTNKAWLINKILPNEQTARAQGQSVVFSFSPVAADRPPSRAHADPHPAIHHPAVRANASVDPPIRLLLSSAFPRLA